MKKLFLSIALIAAVSVSGFAQKANVSKAEDLAKQDKPDFTEARAAIKLALEDESTKDETKTYYVAGLIGQEENDQYLKLQMLQQEVDKDKKGQALLESLEYYLKAYEIDQQPNAKGKVKPKFTKKIKKSIKEYYENPSNLIDYGVYLFEKKDFEGAYNTFNAFLNIPNLPMMEKEYSTKDSTYLAIKYYTGLAASNMKDSQKAIAIYESLKADNYETLNVYELLSDEYRNTQDTVNYVATIKEGFQLFPNEPWFLQNIINYYIQTNKIEDAASYLDAAIAQSPEVPEYYVVKGNVEERIGNLKEARTAFDKAIEINPNQADAYQGIGRLIFNEAVDIVKKADEIKDIQLYNAELEKAKEVFMKSLPFLEKSVELSPEDIDYKQTLKMLYYRLEMNDKYEAISKEIGGE